MGVDQDVEQVKDTLSCFLTEFESYVIKLADFIKTKRPRVAEEAEILRIKLQRKEPKVTTLTLDILGEEEITKGGKQFVTRRKLITAALLPALNMNNFRALYILVTSDLNRALGAIEGGLWPRTEPTPILVIIDDELRNRCINLLSAPGNYDTVIREATTVLEDCIRTKCPHDILSQLIPQLGDQTGENLVNKLFVPKAPVLSVSSDQRERAAFQRILLGVFSYIRNPSHHRLDPRTEWSWAWSTIGLIDRLLADIKSCIVAAP